MTYVNRAPALISLMTKYGGREGVQRSPEAQRELAVIVRTPPPVEDPTERIEELERSREEADKTAKEQQAEIVRLRAKLERMDRE